MDRHEYEQNVKNVFTKIENSHAHLATDHTVLLSKIKADFILGHKSQRNHLATDLHDLLTDDPKVCGVQLRARPACPFRTYLTPGKQGLITIMSIKRPIKIMRAHT